MTLRERQVASVTVVDIDGRVTIQEGADVLREALQRLIREGRWRLVLNCRNVPYIDTSGIGEIVRGYTSVTRRGGSLKLLTLTPHVHHVLTVTGLLTVFETFTDETAAVESFRPAGASRAGGSDGR